MCRYFTFAFYLKIYHFVSKQKCKLIIFYFTFLFEKWIGSLIHNLTQDKKKRIFGRFEGKKNQYLNRYLNHKKYDFGVVKADLHRTWQTRHSLYGFWEFGIEYLCYSKNDQRYSYCHRTDYKADFIVLKDNKYWQLEFSRRKRNTILGFEAWVVAI